MGSQMKYLSVFFMFLLLLSCSTTTELYVQDDKNIEFNPSASIYIQTVSDKIVDLSPRLKIKVIQAGFNVTDERKGAEYILSFKYSARYDVNPWVFRSFRLELTDASGNVLYATWSDSSRFESVESVLTRAVEDMSNRLLVNRREEKLSI